MKEQAKVKCFVSRGRKHGAHRVHHHSGRCRLSRPHRAEDLLHHPHQTGGAVGWVWNMTSTGSRVLWAGSSFSVAPCWSIQGVSFTLSSSSSAGGKDGMVGFPDFIYKHIVPACFLAPLKPTFDLSDAQTVLVSFFISTFNKRKIAFWWQASTVFFFSGSVGVRSDTEDDSSQTGKNVFLWLTKLCYVSPRFHLNTCCFCFRDSNSSSSCSRSTCHHSRWPRKFHRSEKLKPWRPKIPRDVFLYLCSVLFISKCFFI